MISSLVESHLDISAVSSKILPIYMNSHSKALRSRSAPCLKISRDFKVMSQKTSFDNKVQALKY